MTALLLLAALAAAHPQLELRGLQPVAVRGSGFAAAERVHVVLRRPGVRAAETVRTDGGGAFSVRFVGRSIERCAPFTVTATGAAGERAVLLRRPLCPSR